jgi:phosphoenolpyruvate synthase/pyruvate phosphate dikinase
MRKPFGVGGSAGGGGGGEPAGVKVARVLLLDSLSATSKAVAK